jgi:hypothetical protein
MHKGASSQHNSGDQTSEIKRNLQQAECRVHVLESSASFREVLSPRNEKSHTEQYCNNEYARHGNKLRRYWKIEQYYTYQG